MITLLPMTAMSVATRPSRASFYDRTRDGSMPRPVKVGERLSAWPAHETEAVGAATTAGKSRDDIKALVAGLERQRAA